MISCVLCISTSSGLPGLTLNVVQPACYRRVISARGGKESPVSGVRLQPSSSATITSLQTGRAVAAWMVVLYHASGSIFTKYFVGERPVGRVFDFGYAGVDFFFVLSGFIMLHVHRDDLGRPKRLGRYLWKRCTRIYLPYW